MKTFLAMPLKIFLITIISIPFAHAVERNVYWEYKSHEGDYKQDKAKDELKCQTNKEQTLIDFKAPMKTKRYKLEYHYAPLKLPKVVNNGHTLQFSQSMNNHITINGEVYKLLQLHFHVPSKHTKNLKHSELELHLVHQNHNKELAIIGVFIKTGKSNSVLNDLIKFALSKEDENLFKDTEIDLYKLLPETHKYYHYTASLTTPPCSENVKWFVFNEPIEALGNEITAITNILKYNTRLN